MMDPIRNWYWDWRCERDPAAKGVLVICGLFLLPLVTLVVAPFWLLGRASELVVCFLYGCRPGHHRCTQGQKEAETCR